LNNEHSRLKATQHIQSNLQRLGSPSLSKKKFAETRQYSPHFTSDIYALDLEAITAASDLEAITATTITFKSIQTH
jgi:hypothetical protein